MTDILHNGISYSDIEYFHFLVDLTDHILSAHTVPELLKNTADQLHDFLGLEFIAIEIPLFSSHSLFSSFATYDKNGLEHHDCHTAQLDQSFLEEIILNRKNLLLDSTQLATHSERFKLKTQIPIEKLIALLGIPLISDNDVIGIFLIGSFTKPLFTPQNIDLLEKVSLRLALALDVILSKENAYDSLFHQQNAQNLTLDNSILESNNVYDVIGQSKAIKSILRQIKIVADSNATVLLLGETGTGKGLIAQTIHNLSSRKDRTMVRMNCTAIPSELMENELFGHEKGAFTGAQNRSIGHFEQANHSTLFLDEIGDMPIELQPKLLSVLQENQIRRLGGTEIIPLDVRFIAATNNDLIQKINEKTFRSDLYYRLNVFPITVPPLRERATDIPLLVNYFTLKFAQKMGRNITEIPTDTLSVMSHMPWYGNIRELENVIERAVIMTGENHVLNLTPDYLRHLETQTHPESIIPLQKDFYHSVDLVQLSSHPLPDTDRETLIDALKTCHGVIGGKHGTAAKLGLKRTTLLARLKKLHINPDDYRQVAH